MIFVYINLRSLSLRPLYSLKACVRRLSWRVLFFGNDKFSLYSISKLHELLLKKTFVEKLDVVTTTGSNHNLVKKFADKNLLSVLHWPLDHAVCEAYDIGVVVSFGYLIPKKMIEAFPLGMINVHGSLLPKWRGASPIVYSIMNGDSETGISIMRIKPHHFDTGDIILQKSCTIGDDELMPSVYERLGRLGADALAETLATLPDCLSRSVPQINSQITYAPKIKQEIAEFNWTDKSALEIYNLYRALFSVYELKTTWHGCLVKLKKLRLASENAVGEPGTINWCKQQKEVCVSCRTGSVLIDNLSINGKSLNPKDFYNGYLSKRKKEEWVFK